MMISAHYRSPLNYSLEIIEQCGAALQRLYTCRDNLDFLMASAPEGEGPGRAQQMAETRRAQFIAAMDDDLNTADGIAALFELVRDSNTLCAENPTKGELTAMAEIFDELCGVLGLCYNRKKEVLDAEVETLIEARQQARADRNFKEADRIRDELKDKGIILEDTKEGVKWRRA